MISNDPDKTLLNKTITLFHELEQFIEIYEDETNKEKLNVLEKKISIKQNYIEENLKRFKITTIDVKEIKNLYSKLNKIYSSCSERKSNHINHITNERNIDVEEEIITDDIFKQEDLQKLQQLDNAFDMILSIQNTYSEQLQKDTENLDNIISSTEDSVFKTQAANCALIDASKSTTSSRLTKFTAGTTIAGGVVGSFFGAIAGLFVGGGISSAIKKKQNKKFEKVEKDMIEKNKS